MQVILLERSKQKEPKKVRFGKTKTPGKKHVR
jgi:hypothetical protein